MSDLELAQTLWDYMRIDSPLTKSDAIICLGSHDSLSGEYAVDLFQSGLAPKLLFSGGLGRLTKDVFTETEADKFAAAAIKRGVAASDILIENKSTNTAENIIFSEQTLKQLNVDVSRVILVHKPYMQRRTLATFDIHWSKPQLEVLVSASPLSFTDYCKRLDQKDVINIMVGDLQRIREYPKRGFQSEQAIPKKVWDAWQELVDRDYTQHLL